jgi:hypothetical protein
VGLAGIVLQAEGMPLGLKNSSARDRAFHPLVFFRPNALALPPFGGQMRVKRGKTLRQIIRYT